MRKLGRYALRAAVAAFVLGSVALFAANLYVQSHGVQQRIRTTLATLLRTPVSLRKTTVTPWDGLRLDGITLYAPNAVQADAATDLMTAASFRVRLAWWPLLTRRQLVVLQVLLDRPRMTVRDNRDEPSADEAQTVSSPAATAPAPRSAAVPDATPIEPPPAATAPVPIPAAREARLPFAATRVLLPVKKMRLRHGEFACSDHENHPYLRVEEINADGSIADPEHAQAALWFSRAAADQVPRVALTDYWTAVDYDAAAGLTAHDGHGKLAGGNLTTAAQVQPQADRLLFTTADRLDNVALNQLTRPAPDGLPLAEGSLHGNLDLRGFLDDPASFVGGGRFWLSDARLENIPLLAIVGQVLRIADLSQLTFKQAQVEYRVENEVVYLDDLTLVSNDSRVVLRGQYLCAHDQLNLRGRLTIDRAISHQLPQFIESNFTRCGPEAPGSRFLDFDVTGPLGEPKCNLYDRLIAGPMHGLLDNLLGSKPKPAKTPRPDGGRKVPSTQNPTPANP